MSTYSMTQNTNTDHFDPAVVNLPPVSERPTLSGILSADEIDLLGRYVGNAMTQHQIAEQDAAPRSTIEYRIKVAARKLRDAGLPVTLPGRGRRPHVRDVPVDPLAIGCLIETAADDGAGRARRRWNKSKKIDSDGSDRQW